jgi:hypothetical protein
MTRTKNPTRFTLTTRSCLTAFAMVFAALTTVPRLDATAIANSSLQLQSLTITPASGSIMFSPTAQSFAQAQNSLGELVSNFDSGSTANSSASVTWANASGAADTTSRTASAMANVNLPGAVVGAANSVGRGTLYDLSFSVVGASGPDSVQFSVTIPYIQSLVTDAAGVQATRMRWAALSRQTTTTTGTSCKSRTRTVIRRSINMTFAAG